MELRRSFIEEAAFYSALGGAAACAVSIAISQILLGLALACMLVTRARWELPRHWPYLLFFTVWTLLAMAFSDAPLAGMPQIKKFYVWLFLFVVATTFRKLPQARWLVLAWVAGGTLSALWGIGQFAHKWQEFGGPGGDFYVRYVAGRITGLNSHWMTFSGQLMIVLLAGFAFLLWAKPPRWLRGVLLACLAIVALALVLAFTRGVWIATAIGAVYLLWSWKRWSVALVPLAALGLFVAGPEGLRARVTSLVRPHGQTDSNMHRVYTFRTGIEMIKVHPWFGLGLERVGPHVREYIPADLPKELPTGYYGHLHNNYVHFAAERGLPAMAALMLFILLTIKDWFVRLHLGAGEHEWLLRGVVAVMIGILVTGLFEYNLGDSEVLGMTLACLAVPAAVAREENLPHPSQT